MKHFVFFAIALLTAGRTTAQTTLEAFLGGPQEVPSNSSPGTGFGTVTLNAAQTQIVVNLFFSGLAAPATAAHIHGFTGPGTNSGVLFGFTGVPVATSGAIPPQTFSITPAQVYSLLNGLAYFNIHTSTFPGGEIRGQILMTNAPPAPAISSLAMNSNGLSVSWVTALGRTNILQRGSSANGEFPPSNFSNILLLTNTTGLATNFLDSVPTNASAVFYRIQWLR
jgi:hypothetical protein